MRFRIRLVKRPGHSTNPLLVTKTFRTNDERQQFCAVCLTHYHSSFQVEMDNINIQSYVSAAHPVSYKSLLYLSQEDDFTFKQNANCRVGHVSSNSIRRSHSHNGHSMVSHGLPKLQPWVPKSSKPSQHGSLGNPTGIGKQGNS